MTAKQLINCLDKNPKWMLKLIERIHPKRKIRGYFSHELFTECTVRIATGTKNRWGKERLQRRRFDIVFVIQPNQKIYKPVTIGVEVKVNKHDLMNDQKMFEYLGYTDYFLLAVPAELADYALEKIEDVDERTGLLLVYEHSVYEKLSPSILLCEPNKKAELTTELLMKKLFKTTNHVK